MTLHAMTTTFARTWQSLTPAAPSPSPSAIFNTWQRCTRKSSSTDLFNHKAQLLADLNAFVCQRNTKKLPGEPLDEPFTEVDLTKLAYWMATGSGKTLILHLNYYQFLHYNKEPLDNILLVTPNEGLSEQHLAELAASGIPARRFDLNHGGLWSDNKYTVQVIEITKLVEEKRGGGVSVPVEVFEGRNLIFVDEGHKGSGGEAWRKYRDALGETGFTFEYSATFGQALSAARNDPLTAEYGKAIVFDYSYRYFYGDGYGKDFRILNLQDETDEDKTDLLLLGNLLSFYEQQRLFDEQAGVLRPYNLEKPLWVFVGSKVNAVYSENKQKRSDVLTVVRFLHRVLINRNWAVKGIDELMAGKSGLITPDGIDLFAGRFPYVRETGLTAEALYDDILRRVFHSPASGGLHLCDIKSAAGELGLRASGAKEYFGLIYIGDTNDFRKLVETDDTGITLEEDAIASSLFTDINRPDTPLNILIGAKKFMEGWNSWRVSNMGLLNIGRREGSQIIQLFGRGVRLRGENHSLKRSAALPGNHPPHIKLLETLNIFAVRANYMAQFRDYLEREGVETEPPVELPLPVWTNEQMFQRGLVLPRPESGRDFATETIVLLTPDENIRLRVDLSVKVQALESSAVGLQDARAQSEYKATTIPPESLTLVDWEQAYLELLDYKARKGWSNMVIRPETLRAILEKVPYTLKASEAVFRPRTFTDRTRLQEAVTAVLRKYLDTFYRRAHERWDSQNLVYRSLDLDDPNLVFNRPSVQGKKATYIVRVPRSHSGLVTAVEKLCEDMDKLIKEENSGLPRLYFDRSIYLPLLLKKGSVLTADPPLLEESEERFVRDLRVYWEAEKDMSLA
jgi:hypothetical protein